MRAIFAESAALEIDRYRQDEFSGRWTPRVIVDGALTHVSSAARVHPSRPVVRDLYASEEILANMVTMVCPDEESADSIEKTVLHSTIFHAFHIDCSSSMNAPVTIRGGYIFIHKRCSGVGKYKALEFEMTNRFLSGSPNLN